jgi:hypothetical protein
MILEPEQIANIEFLGKVKFWYKLPDGTYFRPEVGWDQYKTWKDIMLVATN